MKKVISFFLFAIFGTMVFFAPVQAQDIGLDIGTKNIGTESGLGHVDVKTTAIQIINISLSFLGIICVSLMVYAGFMWMTAAGNEDQIEKAKKTIYAAVFGLAIILSAWSITTFVIPQINHATTGNAVQVYGSQY